MFPPKAYIVIHKFDIICISEIYLDSSTPFDDNNLEISGYTFLGKFLVHSDHPSNNKRGGVCIFYKSFLSLRIEFSMYNICKKVYVLNLNLVTKFVTFDLPIDPKANDKMTLKLLLKTFT